MTDLTPAQAAAIRKAADKFRKSVAGLDVTLTVGDRSVHLPASDGPVTGWHVPSGAACHYRDCDSPDHESDPRRLVEDGAGVRRRDA